MTNPEPNLLKGLLPGADEFFNALFGGGLTASGTNPLASSYKTHDDFVEYKFPLAGVPQERIDPVIKNGLLKVAVLDSEGTPRTIYRVILKPGLAAERAVASSKDGLLTVQIPYSETRGGVKVNFGKLYTEEETKSSPEEPKHSSGL